MGRIIQLQRQNLGGLKWAENDYKGIINWCTAVGKSFFATYKHPTNEIQGFIQRYLNNNPDNNVLFVVHDKITRKQIYDSLGAFGDKLDTQIKVFTMDKLINIVKSSPLDLDGGLLIIDEIHKMTSNLKRNLWDGTYIKYKHILGLTGTIELIEKYARTMFTHAPIVDTINLAEANELGFIANSEYTIITQNMDSESMDKYKEYDTYIHSMINRDGGRFSELYKFIPALHHNWDNPDFNMNQYSDVRKMLTIMSILQPKGKNGRGGAICKTKDHPNGVYKTNTDFINILARLNGWHNKLDPFDPIDAMIIDNWHPDNLQIFAINACKAWYERPKMVQNHIIKLETVYELLRVFDFKRSIVFGESSKFVDDLHNMINERQATEYAVKYHSKVKIPRLLADGTSKTMKRRKDIAKYAKKLDNPVYGTDKKGKYLECPVHIAIKDVMDYNKQILNKLPENRGVYIFAQAGDTGFNDPLIEVCIIASYSNSKTKARQREGRNLRINENDTSANKQVIYLAFENTYEMRKITGLSEALMLDDIYVEWTTLDGYLNRDIPINLSDNNLTEFDIDDSKFDLSSIGL